MDPMALYLGRFVVWNSCRGNHLGQRSCASAPQAGHMDASDLIKALQNTLRGGGRPHTNPEPGRSALPLGDIELDDVDRIARTVRQLVHTVGIGAAARQPMRSPAGRPGHGETLPTKVFTRFEGRVDP